MKQFLLNFFAAGKNLNGFYAFISNEKNANLIKPYVDNDVIKAFDKAYKQDSFAQNNMPKTFDESISICRYMLSEMLKTRTAGNILITKECITHSAVDCVSRIDGFTQIKRYLNLNEAGLANLISKYSDKGIMTLRVYVINAPDNLIGEHITSFGMKVLISRESDIVYTQEEYSTFLDDFRRVYHKRSLVFEHNQKIADNAAILHKKEVILSKSIDCDSLLSVDEQKKLEEQKNTAVHFALKKYWEGQQQNLIEIEIPKNNKNKIEWW